MSKKLNRIDVDAAIKAFDDHLGKTEDAARKWEKARAAHIALGLPVFEVLLDQEAIDMIYLSAKRLNMDVNTFAYASLIGGLNATLDRDEIPERFDLKSIIQSEKSKDPNGYNDARRN